MLLVNTVVGLKVRRNLRAWLPRLFVAMFACLLLPGASAQSWKDELKAEQAKNSTRISKIDTEGAPIAAKLREVNKAIARHEANACSRRRGLPGACSAYDAEAAQLNSAKDSLRSRLQTLFDEQDRLVARNQEIARRLKCVPLPTPCRSDSDCNECTSCGSFDGERRGGTGVCQPRP
jgi:hypothetical protein